MTGDGRPERRDDGASGSGTRHGATPASAAETALRCAALLRGGVPGARVFAHIASERLPNREAPGRRANRAAPTFSCTGAAAVAARIEAGAGVAQALAAEDGPAWRVLAAAWQLAEQSGAPLAAGLERIGVALRSLEQLGERRAVLLTGPKATIKLVSALPPLALLLGALLGFNPLPVLLSAGGFLLLLLGGTLLAAGIWWSTRLQRRVERCDVVAGLELELVWIALGGGAAPSTACRRVVDSVDGFGAEWVPLTGFMRDAPLARAVAVAGQSGVPLGPMLLEEALSIRQSTQAELEQSAERLGIWILLPLGACVLPSFVVLGVVPVIISMLSGA